MFSRGASSAAKASARGMRAVSSTFQRRTMAGGGAAMEGSSQTMHTAAEVFGVITWLWIFSRARADLPVMLGFRHPWDHEEDPFAPSDSRGHGHGGQKQSTEDSAVAWDKFTMKSIKPGEDDDEDEDEDDDDEDED